jgi:glucan phosphoethanolaminetransferase (alkaline phosphatase superfamily)
MRWLLFLSRLAFICGIFFLLSLSLQVRGIENWAKDETLISNIITIGVFMGLVIVPVANISYLVVWIARKKSGVKRWLIIANILFLFVMLFYIFYLNDPYYHQK